MNLILPYDTETTGLPDWKQPSESPQQPHFVELAMMLVDADTMRIHEAFSALIRPDGWKWDSKDEAFKAHGITFEEAMDSGIPEKEAIERWLAYRERAFQHVAHNKTFDDRMIRIGMKRYGWSDEEADRIKAAPSYCTMNTAAKIMKLPATVAMKKSGRGSWFKPPTLAEAHLHFTGQPHSEAHRAMPDCAAMVRVYFALNPPKAPAYPGLFALGEPPDSAITESAPISQAACDKLHSESQGVNAENASLNVSPKTAAAWSKVLETEVAAGRSHKHPPSDPLNAPKVEGTFSTGDDQERIATEHEAQEARRTDDPDLSIS